MKQEFLLQIYYKNITFKRLSRCQFQMDNLNVWHIRSHYGTVPCSNEICPIFLSDDGRRTRVKQNHWSKIPDCLERECPLWTRYGMKEDISGKLNNVSLPDNAF